MSHRAPGSRRTCSFPLLAVAVTLASALTSLAGCSGSGPDPSFPQPIAVDELPEPPPPPAEPRTDDRDTQTRQSGLRVMAREQRQVLASLSSESRFVRTSIGADRFRRALDGASRELDVLDRQMEDVEASDLSTDDVRDRQDAIKVRLRRVASSLASMETMVREAR